MAQQVESLGESERAMAEETIKINITGDTKGLEKATAKVKINLQEMGEKVSNLGMRMSAAFTLPVLAIGKWVLGNEELKKSLEPIGLEFTKIRDELAGELLPVVRELMPTIMEGVRAIGGLVTAFGELTTEQKINTLRWIGFVAAIGPAITIIGQVIGTIGILQNLFTMMGATLPATSAALRTFGASAYAALGPIGALVLAVSGLIALLNSDFGKRGITAGKQLLALGTREMWTAIGGQAAGNAAFANANQSLGLTGRANGGPVMPGRSYMVGERGPELLSMGASGGMVTPISNRGGGGLTVVINANTVMGDNIDRAIIAPIERWARSKGLV